MPCGQNSNETFYANAPNYCRDTPFTGALHPGRRCYREFGQATPGGDQVCFDAAGNCEDSYDRVDPADGRDAAGCCTLGVARSVGHVVADIVPSLIRHSMTPQGITLFYHRSDTGDSAGVAGGNGGVGPWPVADQLGSSSPFDSQYAGIRERIYYYADRYGIDRTIAIWQLWAENRFRSTGCSGAGACGIAQFTAATAQRFGVDRSNVESSLTGWGKYMSWLLGRSYIHVDIRLALAGYNAGEGRVQQYGGIPPFTETRNYVATIMSNAGPSPASSAGASSSNPVVIANTGGNGDTGSSDSSLYVIGGLLLLAALT